MNRQEILKMILKQIPFFLTVLVLCFLCHPGCTKPTDEEAVKKALAGFNRCYESKDIDKWSAFFSERYISAMEASQPGGFEKWRDLVRKRIFDRFDKITVTSAVSSVEKIPRGYLVMEKYTMVGVDLSGAEAVIAKNIKRSLAFVKQDEKWEIASIQELIVPAAYDSITSAYPEPGKPGLAYVSHVTLNYVSVLDTKINKLIGIIPCDQGAASIAFAHTSNLGYIANSTSNTVTVFDIKLNRKTAAIPVGGMPVDVMVDPREEFLFVSHQSTDGLWVISRKTNGIIRKLTTETGIPYWNSKEGKLYQPQIFTPFVDVIDPAENFSIKKIEIGGRPMALALTPDERYAYVTNFDLNEVDKIDTHTKSVIKRIPGVTSPRGICITSDGKYAVITNVVSGKVTVLDLLKDQVADSVEIGRMPTDASFDMESGRVYVSNQGSSTVAVFDPKNRKLEQTIDVADNPISIIVDNGKAFKNF